MREIGAMLKQCASIKLSTGVRQPAHLLCPHLADTAERALPKQVEQTIC